MNFAPPVVHSVQPRRALSLQVSAGGTKVSAITGYTARVVS